MVCCEYLLCDRMDLACQGGEGLCVEFLFAELNQGHAAADRILNRLDECSGGVVQTRVGDEVQAVVDNGLAHDVLIWMGGWNWRREEMNQEKKKRTRLKKEVNEIRSSQKKIRF